MNAKREIVTHPNQVGEKTQSEGKTARLAGVCFLLMVAFGLFAEIAFRQQIFVLGDIATTADNIMSNISLYRIGIVSDIVMSLSYMLTALLLYRLFVRVDKNLAAAMVVFASAGSLLLLVNILNEVAPLYILSGGDYLSAFTSAQLESLAMFFYKQYQHGYMIGQVFFALWVLPLGLLIYRSGFAPKLFGVLFVAETMFGLMAVGVHFLAPNDALETALCIPTIVAEIPFMLWLLIKGVRYPSCAK